MSLPPTPYRPNNNNNNSPANMNNPPNNINNNAIMNPLPLNPLFGHFAAAAAVSPQAAAAAGQSLPHNQQPHAAATHTGRHAGQQAAADATTRPQQQQQQHQDTASPSPPPPPRKKSRTGPAKGAKYAKPVSRAVWYQVCHRFRTATAEGTTGPPKRGALGRFLQRSDVPVEPTASNRKRFAAVLQQYDAGDLVPHAKGLRYKPSKYVRLEEYLASWLALRKQRGGGGASHDDHDDDSATAQHDGKIGVPYSVMKAKVQQFMETLDADEAALYKNFVISNGWIANVLRRNELLGITLADDEVQQALEQQQQQQQSQQQQQHTNGNPSATGPAAARARGGTAAPDHDRDDDDDMLSDNDEDHGSLSPPHDDDDDGTIDAFTAARYIDRLKRFAVAEGVSPRDVHVIFQRLERKCHEARLHKDQRRQRQRQASMQPPQQSQQQAQQQQQHPQVVPQQQQQQQQVQQQAALMHSMVTQQQQQPHPRNNFLL